MKITMKWLEKKGACSGAREEFETRKMKSIGVKELCTLLVNENKLDWCNWLVSRSLTRMDCIWYVVYGAEQVIDIFEKKYPDDKRPREAIEAAKKYLKNPSRLILMEFYESVYGCAYAGTCRYRALYTEYN